MDGMLLEQQYADGKGFNGHGGDSSRAFGHEISLSMYNATHPVLAVGAPSDNFQFVRDSGTVYPMLFDFTNNRFDYFYKTGMLYDGQQEDLNGASYPEVTVDAYHGWAAHSAGKYTASGAPGYLGGKGFVRIMNSLTSFSAWFRLPEELPPYETDNVSNWNT
jgi:hypothetical protein